MAGMDPGAEGRVGLLLSRLEDLARSLRENGRGLALLALGSVGLERGRLDRWSDLDFFAIVEAGSKAAYLEDPAWLEDAHPLAWRFRNTVDGFKLLFADGVFAEMAVFEPEELAAIPFREGRAVWVAPGFDPELLRPRNLRTGAWKPPTIEHAVGELASCLYVGLCRFRRGERLSAWRFIQGHCLDRALELVELEEAAVEGEGALRDAYSLDRRLELRHPAFAALLPRVLLGYERSPESALVLLEWLEARHPVNPALKAEILALARSAD
jgi:hypothetical protein